MLRSLLYTSRKKIPLDREPIEIANILTVAGAHNEPIGITGGLVNTGYAFAQLLEGPSNAIDDLMSRIEIDRRHENIRVLRSSVITHRRLPHWSMAYSGSWTYVAKRVEPSVRGDTESDHRMINSLVELIVAFGNA